MKKISYLFLMYTLLLTGCQKDDLDPRIIDIPDDAFLNALIEKGVDTNGDGKISIAEAKRIDSLNVDGWNIINLDGIEMFINLIDLDCGYNQLTSLDVSNITALEWLDCHGNQLTSLDVSTNTALEWLFCGYNQLINLDVSNNTALEGLNCESNQFTSLDVSTNTALEWLFCGYNQLTYLDISNNTQLEVLFISNMRSLYKVCVWTLTFPPGYMYVYTEGSRNVYFTTDCSK